MVKVLPYLMVPKLQIRSETIDSYEIGYKGKLSKNFFIDVNAYYNQSNRFISPLVNIATNGRTVTHVGDKPIGRLFLVPMVLLYLLTLILDT
jgi:iron complex outermembrane receptor protein